MHKSVNNLIVIQKLLKEKTIEKKQPKIIAVSKTFAMSEIKPLIDFGHKDFGENKIQEAIEKWPQVKEQNKEVKLHMIGKLQTNKVKFLIPLFDYLHSLDNLKLARKISLEEKKKGKKIKMFIQVNIGEERQKNGVHKEFVKEFYNICKNELNLDRLLLFLLSKEDKKISNNPIIICVFDNKNINEYNKLLQILRTNNVNSEVYMGDGNLKSQLKMVGLKIR